MNLFRKIILPVVVILLYTPITTNAGFVVKKAGLHTTGTVVTSQSASGQTVDKIITVTNKENESGDKRNAVVHKRSFFGKIAHKLAHVEDILTAGKKKWIAILLGLLDMFVIGAIGLPRFYMGYTPEGLMQLIFYLLGGVGIVLVVLGWGLPQTSLLIPGFLCIGLCIFSIIWQIVDIIRILCNDLKPKDGYWED